MTSIVSICNLALSHLGKASISALSEATTEARACNQFYAHTLDTLLSSYPWSFAAKTATLAEVTNTKAGAWGYAYKRPNDCLKVRLLRSTYSTITGETQDERTFAYDIEGDTIYSDTSPAVLRYTATFADPGKFPALFVVALSWHLAVNMAMPLTRDAKSRADAFQLATRTQAAAEAADANETRNTYDHVSEFVTARG